ncbi:MAG TPA: putative porin [Gracilimonas sp.]|uniref:putative porin n=1 Tax=Gracilimonas sp. TaxID=1974203 RepID=UPI002DADC8E3|nr:putative porin [Gracilimonas sp.]
MKKIILLHIILFSLPAMALAQNPDSIAVDSSATEFIVSDSLASVQDTLVQNQEEEPEPGQVTPWSEKPEAYSFLIATDSLLRWQVWPNWGDYQAYRRDVISFRQGTTGRVDAFHINGYGPYEQHLELDGLSLNNPITGLVNYNLVPHRKISKAVESYGGNYESNIRIRDYYIIKPRSYLNYDEANGAYRNLEFMVAQNFTESTNLEISYWDRRGGSYYPNSGVEGNQIVGRLYHHLNDRFLIRSLYLRNQLNKDEPFGYNVGDPSTFPFDEFSSVPRSSNANSEFNRWDLLTGIYHRRDSSAAEDAGLELSITKNTKDLFFSADTLSHDFRTLSANIFKSVRWKNFEIRGEVGMQQISAEEFTPVSKTQWSNFNAGSSLSYQLSDNFLVYAKGDQNSRNDGKAGYDITGGVKLNLFKSVGLSGSISQFSRMPTIQSLYWESENYRGNENLDNEKGISATGSIDLKLGQTLTFGSKGRFKMSKNATFLTPDSSFTNSQSLEQLSATVFGRFENDLFEIESSGTIQEFNYEDESSPVAVLNNQDMIIWLRNSAFVKGYVFDRAAYLKLGVKTLLSPFVYSARTYNTELGYWQGNSTYQELPPFFRLDGELSARVRGIMVVLRWENALDGLGQAGYFEAAGFPMPPRRLIVGIRAQFRN